MAASRILILLLLSLPASVEAFSLPSPEPRPSLFQSTDADEKPKSSSDSFKRFAFGSVLGVYPYHAYLDDQPRGEMRDSWPFVWIDFRGAATLSDAGKIGWNADFHFQMLFGEAAALARQWNSGSSDEQVSVYGGWLGATLPLADGIVAISAGVGGADVRYADNKSAGGVMLATRVLAFPLWPLSVSVDAAVILGSKVQSYDFGGQLGVMLYRHLFLEAGYRATWVSRLDTANHGFSIGLAFFWRIGSPSSGFEAPWRKNTW